MRQHADACEAVAKPGDGYAAGITPDAPDSGSAAKAGWEYPDLMTEEELIDFLRIPLVSKAEDYHNVIKNLIRFRDLPRIEICHRLLFPKESVLAWIERQTVPRMSLTRSGGSDTGAVRRTGTGR